MDRSAFLNELKNLNDRFNLLTPELELTLRDHSIGVEGYVVVFNTAPGKRGILGPCGKGGTRITPTLSLDEVKMLASRMPKKRAKSRSSDSCSANVPFAIRDPVVPLPCRSRAAFAAATTSGWLVSPK